MIGAKDDSCAPSSDVREALAFAERIATVCSHVLGEALDSVIVHGSLVLDDYTALSSDIDLLAIVQRSLRAAEVESLTRALNGLAREAPSRVDLRLVTRAVAARPSAAPPMELYVRCGGHKPAMIERRNRGEPDMAVELSVCRSHGRALRGAAADTVIGAVPERLVLTAGHRQLVCWQSLTEDTAYAGLMVLTACRIWRFSVTGTHSSKSAAGSWALGRDPSLAAVRAALRQRAGDPVRIDPGEIARVLRAARASVAARRGMAVPEERES